MSDPLCLPMRVAPVGGAPAPARGGPCTMVILGAAGDLTRRKLLPSLLHLEADGLLHDDFAVVGVAREPLSDEAFREQARATLGASGGRWSRFAPRLFYAAGNLRDPATYDELAKRLRLLESTGGSRGRLFYLAVPPSMYEGAIEGLSRSGAMPRRPDPADPAWVRTVIEKPFGRSLATAQALNRVVRAALAEHQVYRIDHYLGKETVQNLLVFRFANSIFEPVWNRHHVHHVQITAAETLGVEHRAGYYEEAGVVRDMFQNHLLSLLSLTAMEPPSTFQADAVRDEKVKVLNAIRPIPAADLAAYAVRGQYGPGTLDGTRVPGYREEEGVRPDSVTPTYAALQVMIDNWRWEGVPFLLRSGKRLPRRATEIAIQFRKPPHLMFPVGRGDTISPNVLVMQVQPEEGLSLSFEIKVPGLGVRMTSARMEFGYAEAFGGEEHDAYETLLLDCMAGDPTLFLRADATEAAWRVVDPVLEAWEREPPADFPNYPAGSWGPAAAERLIACAGASWRRP
ncbi:MAG TPA: glucose-6-phosphate dehydrogenase [Gemmatimonadales bacterium]|nr:glucose-6-phosphate dehydrogenase [Gemmatimonadales bacterium]